MSKTPVTFLQELCMKRRHGQPQYNLTIDGSNVPGNPQAPGSSTGIVASVFEYQVAAFDVMATGRGKNKRDAKHEASTNLIHRLRQLPEFDDDATSADFAQFAAQTTSTTMPTLDGMASGGNGGDAVGTLLDICVQREWPLAAFTVTQAFGTAHAPEFSVECRVASIVRTGTFSTKKRAKQIAAQAMLDVIQSMAVEEHQMQIATLVNELPEKHVRTYRELRQSDIKSYRGTKLCDRHKFFQRMEPSDKAKWQHIMYELNESAMEKVHMLCRTMGWKAVVESVAGHPDGTMRLFTMQGCSYDVAIAGKSSTLYDDVLEYFQEMSGVRSPNAMAV